MGTTIGVELSTRSRINKLKYALGVPTMDEALNRALDIVEKIRESKNGK